MSGKDSRLYGRFSLDFPDSPKIAPLSDSAFRALVEMTLYSRRMLSDGFIDERIVKLKWKPKAVQELLQNDNERPSILKVDGGYRIHDFEEHQQTRADIELKRDAGRAGGLAKARKLSSKPLAHAVPPASASQKSAASTTLAITETETETSTTDVVDKEARKRATRLTTDWEPDSDLRAWAATETPHVNPITETARFIDYWIAQPGQKGVKTDWAATWRNWMRRNEDDIASKRKQSPTERVSEVIDMGRRLQEQSEQRAVEA